MAEHVPPTEEQVSAAIAAYRAVADSREWFLDETRNGPAASTRAAMRAALETLPDYRKKLEELAEWCDAHADAPLYWGCDEPDEYKEGKRDALEEVARRIREVTK